MTKESLAAVALLTEADAARHFNMGTTRFKSRCVGQPQPSRSNETAAVRLLFPPRNQASVFGRALNGAARPLAAPPALTPPSPLSFAAVAPWASRGGRTVSSCPS